jgi:peptide/nickel transport system ATP-binding protein
VDERPEHERPDEPPVLEACGLEKTYRVRRKGQLWGRRHVMLRAVDGVSLSLFAGRTVALVGQSGSGKSTLVKLLAQLEGPSAGTVKIDGGEAGGRWGRRYKRYTGLVQIVLQDPYASLNPGYTVGRSIRRPLKIHRRCSGRAEREAEVLRLLEQVKLHPASQFVSKLPHELSGGQRQRVAIARALAVGPRVLLADEPVSMLDVAVKIEILKVLGECRERLRLAMLYVTHDIASARWCADTIAVMYGGQIVEYGPSEAVTQSARHPYTRLLIAATPDPAADRGTAPDQVPSAGSAVGPDLPPGGCRYRLSCPYAMPTCAQLEPPAFTVGDQHWARCWLHEPNGTAPGGANDAGRPNFTGDVAPGRVTGASYSS